jgi:pilus assembly protein CpaF
MALPSRPIKPGETGGEPVQNAPVAPPEPVQQAAPLPTPQYVPQTPQVAYEHPVAPLEDEDLIPDVPQYEELVRVAEPAPAETYEEYVPSLEDEEIEVTISSFSPAIRENAIRLLELISEDGSSEVIMNGPSEIIFKKGGQRYSAENIDFGDVETYHKVINTLILPNTDTADRIGPDSYLIEGQLELADLEDPENIPPLIARVHILAPPAVSVAKVTIAKKAKHQFNIDDLQRTGSMSPQMAEFLKAISRGRATTVFSGLSGSGKTTLLEAMSNNFDPNDRVIVVEDTAELRLPVADVVSLKSTSAKPGHNEEKTVTMEWLVQQANRMRPDRIIVGEVRGSEMAEFLSAANSGADGSMTTVHASSPRQTIDKIVSLALKSESAKNQEAILRDISSTVQIVVQTGLIDGQHIISHIEEISDTIVRNGAGVATNPLFEYDRNTGAFKAVGRPSDNLTYFLAQRGVSVEPSWFSRGA